MTNMLEKAIELTQTALAGTNIAPDYASGRNTCAFLVQVYELVVKLDQLEKDINDPESSVFHAKLLPKVESVVDDYINNYVNSLAEKSIVGRGGRKPRVARA